MPKYERIGTYRSTTGLLDKNQLMLLRRDGPLNSKKSLGRYWIFYWYDVETGHMFTTYVDSTMSNFNAWKHICEDAMPYGVYEGLAVSPRTSKNSDLPVISADGLPERWLKLTESLTREVIELDQEERSQPNNFNRLFA